jgi:hypothetical protein
MTYFFAISCLVQKDMRMRYERDEEMREMREISDMRDKRYER